MKAKKFNFISVNQILDGKAEVGSTCSFNAKSRMLTFNAANPDIDRYRNALIRLFVDASKNTIAWKFLEKGTPLNAEQGIFQVKEVVNNATGSTKAKIYLPIKLLKQLDIRNGSKYRKMPIAKYQESMIEGIEPFYYVTLENPLTDKEIREMRVIEEETKGL